MGLARAVLFAGLSHNLSRSQRLSTPRKRRTSSYLMAIIRFVSWAL